MNCKKCGTKMITNIEGSCLIIRCPNCGYSLVTTDIEEIRADSTIYAITIFHVPNPTIPQIQLVSKLANVNWLHAKHLLALEEVLIVQDKAPKIMQIIPALNEANITYKIFPKYKY